MKIPWCPRISRSWPLALALGCSTADDRLRELSEQSVARQADQNKAIARQSQQVAEAAHELVQADARARADLIAAQQSLETSLQAERSRLDQQRENLDQDRQALAAAKVREPIIANSILSAGLLVALVLPLVICIYLLRTLGTNDPGQDLGEVLVYELSASQPMLLPPPPAFPRLKQDAPPSGDKLQG